MNHVTARIHKIVPRSYVDGPGCRSVVFFQGCTLACPGCQNRHIWPSEGGQSVDTDDLAETLALLAGESEAVTISGGEPWQQPEALFSLVLELYQRGIDDIVLYTGYTWEEIQDYFPARFCLLYIKTLVDGRFIQPLDDPMIAWRGSRNQRPIDVQASLIAGHPVILDWDSPQVVVTPAGNILLPAGLAEAFSTIGAPAPTRMRGQTRGQP